MTSWPIKRQHEGRPPHTPKPNPGHSSFSGGGLPAVLPGPCCAGRRTSAFLPAAPGLPVHKSSAIQAGLNYVKTHFRSASHTIHSLPRFGQKRGKGGRFWGLVERAKFTAVDRGVKEAKKWGMMAARCKIFHGALTGKSEY